MASANKVVVDGRLLGFLESTVVALSSLTKVQSRRVTICCKSLENAVGMNDSTFQGGLLLNTGRLFCVNRSGYATYSKAHISYKTQPKLTLSALAS